MKKVIAYTDPTSEWKLGQSLHLAIATDNGIVPLNFGYGVLFAPANFENTEEFIYGATRTLINPWLFRLVDGRIGVVAEAMEGTLVDNKEVSRPASLGKLLFWTTDDLVVYDYHGLISIATGEPITKPQVSNNNGSYTIIWETNTGTIRESTTNDFQTFTLAQDSNKSRETFSITLDQGQVSCMFSVTAEEANYLEKKLGEVKNIGIKPIENITVPVGKHFTFTDLPKLTALYSDGSTAVKQVKWNETDFNKIDFNTPGTYPIQGNVVIKDYQPLISQRADPDIILYNDKYYFIATDDRLQERLLVRVSDTLEGLTNADDHLILSRNESGDLSGLFWAPEFHVINNRLCILFAGSTESARPDWWKHVQCRIMMLKEGGDPLKAADWEVPQRVMMEDGVTPLHDETGITLDMTYFIVNGIHYYMWSQRKIVGGIDSANLMIATVDPAYPAKITSEPVLILKPQFGWDRQGEVSEGPYLIRKNDDLFITFSGSNTNNTYAVGMLSAKAGADLLNPESWRVTGYPILASNHVAGEYGPGHNSFVTDEYGNDVLVYHARPNNGARSSGMRTVHWAFDGTPILYMTPERELKPEFKQVTLELKVE